MMPTTRRRRTRQLRPALSLNSFSLRDKLRFMSGWTPRDWPDSPWKTWSEYLSDYEAIRDDFIARFRTGIKATWPEYYADAALRIRNERGLSALEAMTWADIYEERRTPR